MNKQSTASGTDLPALLADAELLYDVSRDLNAARYEREVLLALSRPGLHHGATYAVLLYIGTGDQGQPAWAEVVAQWQQGATPPDRPQPRYHIAEHPLVRLCRSSPHRIQFIPDVTHDARVAEYVGHDLHALALIPLVWEGNWLAVLAFGWAKPTHFSQRIQSLLENLAGLSAPVIANRRLRAQLEALVAERTHELVETNRALQEDVKARRTAVAAAELYAARLRMLHEMDELILGARSPEAIAMTGLGRLRQLTDCQRVTVIEILPHGTSRVLAADAASDFGTEPAVWAQPGWREVFNRRRLLGVEDLAEAPHPTALQAALLELGTRAYAIIPLLFQEELVGVLTLEANRPRAFTSEHIDAAAEVAALLAVAIRQARLYDALQEHAQELVAAKRQAEAANQAKTAFLANVSHELRTPLNAILGFTQLLVDSNVLPPEKQQDMELVIESGEHLLSLINELLDIAKIEAGRITLEEEALDLYRFLYAAEDMFRLQAEEKGLNLTLECPADLPRHVQVDRRKLHQVLVNLLSNAIKFSEEGTVTLRVSHSRGENKGRTRLNFAVSDTGPGIAQEELPLLFEPFMQTSLARRRTEGAGLGLAISREFVHLMGGDLTVTSQLQEGTTFSFSIDVTPVELMDVTPLPQQRKIVGLAEDQPTYRVLIVDDHEEGRRLLRTLLTPFDFEIREAATGGEALEVWSTWQPDLIWLDIRLPEVGGEDVIRHIRSQPGGDDTVIIALTAIAFSEERARVMEAGCDAFITKPYRKAQIYRAMEEHLGLEYRYQDT